MEKKHIVHDLKVNYNGPLSIEGFYAEVDKWLDERGLEKEIKRKSEDVNPKDKKIEWVIEAWKEVTQHVKRVVRLRVLFDNVKEIRVKRRGHTIRVNQADVLVDIDGFLETKLQYQWTQHPIYTFLRVLYDKYVWMIIEKHEGPVNQDCYDLHRRLTSFFNLSKMKVE